MIWAFAEWQAYKQNSRIAAKWQRIIFHHFEHFNSGSVLRSFVLTCLARHSVLVQSRKVENHHKRLLVQQRCNVVALHGASWPPGHLRNTGISHKFGVQVGFLGETPPETPVLVVVLLTPACVFEPSPW